MFERPTTEVPVFGTVASQWDDPGSSARIRRCARAWSQAGAKAFEATQAQATSARPPHTILPDSRTRYLSEIAAVVRRYHARTAQQAERAADAEAFARTLRALGGVEVAPAEALPEARAAGSRPRALLRRSWRPTTSARSRASTPASARSCAAGPSASERYAADKQTYRVRDEDLPVKNYAETLAHTKIAKVALPQLTSWRELTRYLRAENLPGHFPFTAGVFPFKREGEAPSRMFAGEGSPERTNHRFHLLSVGQPAVRLSTAFDSVTLYGRDPDERPDIFGKVGNSGVSVCTLDDAKKLYSGFDLCDPKTSVSMTINGPAPTVLAFFLNAAIDQQVEKHLRQQGKLDQVRAAHAPLPSYQGALPLKHDGLGLGLLGIPARSPSKPRPTSASSETCSRAFAARCRPTS